MCDRDDPLAASSRKTSAHTENGARSRWRSGSHEADREVRLMTPMQWEDSDLAGALAALRQDEARIETPPHVEAAVLAAWDRAHAPRVDARLGRPWRRAAALAAAVTIAVGLAQLGRELRQVTQTSRPLDGR